MSESGAQQAAGVPGGGVPVLKLLLGALALVGLVVLGRLAGDYVPVFREWVDDLGFWGPLVFMGGYAAALEGEPIATAGHCYGCTAGAGSSCGGELAEGAPAD